MIVLFNAKWEIFFSYIMMRTSYDEMMMILSAAFYTKLLKQSADKHVTPFRHIILNRWSTVNDYTTCAVWVSKTTNLKYTGSDYILTLISHLLKLGFLRQQIWHTQEVSRKTQFHCHILRLPKILNFHLDSVIMLLF